MKHTLLFVLIASLFATQAMAQIPVVNKVLPKVTVGIKVGANFQQLTGNDTWQSAYKGGILGGAFVGITKNRIGVQVEGLVKSASFDTKASGFNNQSVTIKAAYIDVPVLFEYKIVSRLWLQIGPQFSDMLSAKQGSDDVKQNFNTTDFSGVIGLNVILPLHFTVGGRYILGLTDVNHESVSGATQAWNNRSIQLYLGFRFL